MIHVFSYIKFLNYFERGEGFFYSTSSYHKKPRVFFDCQLKNISQSINRNSGFSSGLEIEGSGSADLLMYIKSSQIILFKK